MKATDTPMTALWLRDKKAVATYGISRTKLWQLQKQGKIRSVSLTEPGMSRATRLFDAKSIESYIESFLPKGQQTKGETEVMKKPPFQVAPSKSRFDLRQKKATTQDHERKLVQIKDSLPSYLERYHGERITRRNDRSLTLHCPLHEDRTPSFTADARKGSDALDVMTTGFSRGATS